MTSKPVEGYLITILILPVTMYLQFDKLFTYRA